jgi:SAM-dependent methyltransferase
MLERAEGVVEAIGVDISTEAIQYAREHFRDERIHFLQHDAMTFTDERGFDSIVSLETIEHLPDPKRLVNHLVDLLQPEGVLIASVPTTPSVYANPYHLHDFSERSFRRLFEAHGLTELVHLKQVLPYTIANATDREHDSHSDRHYALPLWKRLSDYLAHPWSFTKRLWSILRHGFNDHTITIVWRK